MKNAVKYFILTLLFTGTIYFSIFFILYAVKYKDKPVVYITNNYYNWKGGDTYAKFKEFDVHATYDVIILGSSRAYRGYSPFFLEKLGFEAFNLGTSAQSLKNTYFVLKNYINNKNCGLLIVDVFAGSFAPNQLESSSDLIQNISDIKVAAEISFNYPDIRTLNMLTLRILNQKDAPYFNKDDYSGKGYSANKQTLNEQLKTKITGKNKIEHTPFILDPEQLCYFKKIADFIKEQQINAVFIYSPVSYFYNSSAHAPLINEIKPILNKANLPFYDYSRCDSLTTVSHFYDESHLNEAGVEIFNRQLFSKLSQDKILIKK